MTSSRTPRTVLPTRALAGRALISASARVDVPFGGRTTTLHTADGLFSADRLDDGTRLLLDHPPPGTPARILDVGCGYGALTLPVWAADPSPDLWMVDRDLRAVDAARRNAASLHGVGDASRLHVQGSLGYRDVPANLRFDWILCNVPARIGATAIGYLMREGARRLTPSGELRVVVITDLGRVVEQVCPRARRIVDGARHIVYALGPDTSAPPLEADDAGHDDVYGLDEISREFDGTPVSLSRFQDASEDPDHATEGLPLLLDLLPRRPQGKTLVWRGGYGAAACLLARRGAQVHVADTDLLATTTARLNARSLAVPLTTQDCLLAEIDIPPKGFRLVAAELSTRVGIVASVHEIDGLARALAPGGEAYWLGPTRAVADILAARKKQPGVVPLGQRGRWTVLRVPSLRA